MLGSTRHKVPSEVGPCSQHHHHHHHRGVQQVSWNSLRYHNTHFFCGPALFYMGNAIAIHQYYRMWLALFRYISLFQKLFIMFIKGLTLDFISVPNDVEHTLVWTKMPIYHLDLIADSVKTRIYQDGLWGFTGSGSDDLPPRPSNLPFYVSKLARWGETMDTMVKSDPPTEKEAISLKRLGARCSDM